MEVTDQLSALRTEMAKQGIDLLLAFHDGAHFIEKPNAVMALSGFKAIGHSLLIVPRDDGATLVLTPRWDAQRAAELVPAMKVSGVDDIIAALEIHLKRLPISAGRVGSAGLAGMPWPIGEAVKRMLGGEPAVVDKIVFANARRKTAGQIANARAAVKIAEKGYERLLEIARPGMREDDLAVELKLYMRSLGADDNFLMLCAGHHNRAVQPSSGRRLERGDIILAEITPSYKGQMAQICRTAVLGAASPALKSGYDLVVKSMKQGIATAVQGAAMAEVCRAIDAVLEAKGYGEFCHPPHIRRRGHGLGFGSNVPGDVSLDNSTILEPNMFFVIHPNQYLPEAGYLLCGEPVLITSNAPEVLSERIASLAEISI
jgi:Xaa-Pro aminopeptidase